MKITFGAIKKDPDFKKEGLFLLKEPSTHVSHFIMTTLGIALFLIFGYAWTSVGVFGDDKSIGIGIYLLLTTLFIAVVIHELIHVVCYPLSHLKRVTIGIYPLLIYALYSGKLTKNRLLVVYVMPFLIISVLPLLYAQIFDLNENKNLLLKFLAVASIWNAGCSAGDIFGIYLISRRVPRGSVMVNNGPDTYFYSSSRS